MGLEAPYMGFWRYKYQNPYCVILKKQAWFLQFNLVFNTTSNNSKIAETLLWSAASSWSYS
jgi:hypothetical protein